MVDSAVKSIDRARAALAQPEPKGVETQPAPSGYAYRYPSIEGSVIRFNHGQEVNGSRPLCAIPYWLGQPPTPQPSPVPVAEAVTEKQVMDLADDCAFDRQEISGFDGGRTFHGHGWECTDEQLVTFATELLTRYTRPTTEPVPVAERLPGPEDCDAMGRCWWFTPRDGNPAPFRSADWSLYAGWRQKFTHWLPHHALPVPGAEEAPSDRGSESSLAEFNDGGMPLG
jgi:hypothetical protein